jgi:hypothetical protein
MPKKTKPKAASKTKPKARKSKDSLVKTSPKGAVELSEKQLDKVAGGTEWKLLTNINDITFGIKQDKLLQDKFLEAGKITDVTRRLR